MNDETPETGKLTICGERREGGFGAERPIRRLEEYYRCEMKRLELG